MASANDLVKVNGVVGTMVLALKVRETARESCVRHHHSCNTGAQLENQERDVAKVVSPPVAVGVVENGNSAVLVTVTRSGELLDRRGVDLTESGLPTHPHHHEGSWAVGRYLNTPWARPISLAEAVALVEQVRESAEHGARDCLSALAAAVRVPISCIAIRVCPALPPTTEERIRDNRAQSYADSVMYRQALASAGAARGWSVYWYDRESVFADAATVLGRDCETFLVEVGRAMGAPWQAKHKLATAAALAAFGSGERSRAGR